MSPFVTRPYKLSGRVRRGKRPEPQFSDRTERKQKKGVHQI